MEFRETLSFEFLGSMESTDGISLAKFQFVARVVPFVRGTVRVRISMI